MDIKAREGCCRFCGQVGVVECPDLPQPEIDELVTSMCYCADAENLRTEKDRELRVLENTDKAKKSITRLFEDHHVIRQILLDNAEHVARGTICNLTLKMANIDMSASLKLKNDGSVRVERKDTQKRVEE